MVNAHDALVDSKAVLEVIEQHSDICSALLKELEPGATKEFLHNPVEMMKPLYKKFQASQKQSEQNAAGSKSIMRLLGAMKKRPRDAGVAAQDSAGASSKKPKV